MNELQTHYISGQPVYAIIRNSALEIYQTTTTTFVAENDGNWADYAVALTEQGDTGFFSANFPSPITTPDNYAVEFFSGVGVVSDTYVTGGTLAWDGGNAITPLTGNMLCSLNFVKDYANITLSTYDTYLTNRIITISDIISNYCDRTFQLQDYTELYDGQGSTTLLLHNTPVVSLTSVTINIDSPNSVAIDGSNFSINKKTGLISAKPDTSFFGYFNYDDQYGSAQQSIQVVYSAGYASPPYSIQEVCADAVYRAFQRRGTDTTMQSEKIGEYSYVRKDIQVLNDENKAILWMFRDVAV